MNNSNIIKIQEKLKSKLISQNNYFKQTLLELDNNRDLNAHLEVINSYKYNINNNDSLLNNIYYAVKDNINVLDTITTGGSLFLKNYKSPYSASVIKFLDQAGAIPICKANLDEFGLGGTGLYSAYGYVKNPLDETRITSGSSSGSAVLVAKNIVPFALGTDTGDSIRMPSSFLGIYGFKPTYGLVSRYGVFPYSPSLDHVGVMTNSIYDIMLVMNHIAKYDENDFTSQNININFLQEPSGIRKPKVCYFKNVTDLLNEKEKKLFYDTLDSISSVCEISAQFFSDKLLDLIPTIYEILSYSEAVSCYQNITGIPFGEKDNAKNYIEKVINTRTKNFGNELKRRFVLGSYCTLEDNYEEIFLKCKKIRKLIVDESLKFFKEYDYFIMPSSFSIAPKITDVLNGKFSRTRVDNFLQVANFGGFPSLTIPMGKIENMPMGINICGNNNTDSNLLWFSMKIDCIIRGVKNER